MCSQGAGVRERKSEVEKREHQYKNEQQSWPPLWETGCSSLSYRTFLQNCQPGGRKREASLHRFLFSLGQGLLRGPGTSTLPTHECLEVFTEKIWVRKWEGWGTLRLFLCQIGLSIWGTASMIIRNRRSRGVFCFFLEYTGFLILSQVLQDEDNVIGDQLLWMHSMPHLTVQMHPSHSTFQILTMPIVQSFLPVIALTILGHNASSTDGTHYQTTVSWGKR